MVLFVFFFKQKTAYELRISDWSSDVCSSDLTIAVRRVRTAARRARSHPIALGSRRAWPLPHVRRADRSLSFARRGGLGADRRARARADARDGGLAMGAVRLVATAAPIARRAALLVARPAQRAAGGRGAAVRGNSVRCGSA